MNINSKTADTSVGVLILDCDHHEMHETFQEIRLAAERNESPRRIASLLGGLADFTLSHFALEEEMMAATRYPAVSLHSRRHRRLATQMRAIAASCASMPSMPTPVLDLLIALHTQHIQSEDLLYGKWLHSNRLR